MEKAMTSETNDRVPNNIVGLRLRCSRRLAISLMFAVAVCVASDRASSAPNQATPGTSEDHSTHDHARADRKLKAPADPDEMQPQVRELLAKARKAALDYPESPEAWGQWGRVCDAHKLFDCAESCYRRAYQLAPNDFTYPYLLASVLDFSGRGRDESITLYKEAAGLNPAYAQIQWRLGYALERQGKLAEARDAYLAGVAIDSKFAMAHRGAAQAMLGLGDVESARKHLELAVRLSPNDGAIHAALSQVYRRTGDAPRAKAEAELARRNQPIFNIEDPVRDSVARMAVDSVSAYATALQLIDDGEYAKAIPYLKVAAAADPTRAVVQIYLGTAYHRTEEPQLAMEHLTKAIALDDTKGSAYLELAALYMDLGRMQEAETAYKKVDELSPRNGRLHVWIADEFMKRGELYRATKAWETASLYKILDAREFSRWGAALLGLGDVDGAAEKFGVAVGLDAEYENAWYNLGIAFEQAGKRGEAIVAHQRALEINPDGDSVMRLHALLPQDP